MDSQQPRLLTPLQAAEVLQLSRTRIFALIASGELQSVKIGRSRRIPAGAVDQYISSLLQVKA